MEMETLKITAKRNRTFGYATTIICLILLANLLFEILDQGEQVFQLAGALLFTSMFAIVIFFNNKTEIVLKVNNEYINVYRVMYNNENSEEEINKFELQFFRSIWVKKTRYNFILFDKELMCLYKDETIKLVDLPFIFQSFSDSDLNELMGTIKKYKPNILLGW